MSSEGDYIQANQIKALGDKFRIIGWFVLISVIIRIGLKFGLAFIIEGALVTNRSIQGAVHVYISQMKTFVIGTYFLEFIEFFIILMIVHDLMTLGKDDNFTSGVLRTVKWTFILAVAIRYLAFLLGLIESMVYFQHIRENTNEFNQLRTVIDAGQSFLLISNITKLVSLLIMSYAFFQLRNYFYELTTRFAEPEFQRASDAIEKVALAQFPFIFAILFIFTPANFLSLMFSAIGLILLVYGYLVTGKALSNMRPKLSKVPEKYYRI